MPHSVDSGVEASDRGIILTWNPVWWDAWAPSYEDQRDMLLRGEAVPKTRWSVGRHRYGIEPGMHAWLFRQGAHDRGLHAYAVVTSEPYEDIHWRAGAQSNGPVDRCRDASAGADRMGGDGCSGAQSNGPVDRCRDASAGADRVGGDGCSGAQSNGMVRGDASSRPVPITAMYVDVEFKALLSVEQTIPVPVLEDVVPGVRWRAMRQSGTLVDAESTDALCTLWREWSDEVN